MLAGILRRGIEVLNKMGLPLGISSADEWWMVMLTVQKQDVLDIPKLYVRAREVARGLNTCVSSLLA